MVRTIQSEWIFLQRVTWNTGGAFAGVEKIIWEKICLILFSERQNSLVHCRVSKYDVNQDIWIGTPESSDVRKVEVTKLSAGKRGTDLGHDGGRGILQC